MGIMLMPQAFPLAILLSSLIAFGNLGESSELTAIKAAGISLLQSMRSLIVITIGITLMSFYFQEVIGPKAFISFRQLLISMKQKNPEVEIPEGIFYDGIPGSNLYVQKKDVEKGMLYGIMIYRMNGGYEDAAVILADSGRIQATEEKKHMLLTLYSGEWFENMRQGGMGVAANVPYRRETFSTKRIVLDFDSGFDMAEASGIASDARSKGLSKIMHDLDSIREFNDSVGHQYYKESTYSTFHVPHLSKEDSLKVLKEVAKTDHNFDAIYLQLPGEQKQSVLQMAANDAKAALNDLEFKSDYSDYLNTEERLHQMEAINKFTLSLSCLIFFFIGAPLGAIIRKGGLGVPVIISVLVFIVFYILDNTGMKMARDDNWTVWFGKFLGTAVLSPIAFFFTYKANNDSVVFNVDLYKSLMMRMLGLRQKRPNIGKEVIIETPDYAQDAVMLRQITSDIEQYTQEHRLRDWPNPIKVFFRPGDDQAISRISDTLESVIEDLSNTRDKVILNEVNTYPILATHAHTRPFRRKWLNIITGLVVPAGIFFYIRMLRFRLRLYRDLKVITKANQTITKKIETTYINKV
jgi:lipopolysaccharide export system permease protein